VPLTLVTGPANAEKAGFVLGAYRDALEDESILVVPTFADVDHYRRELAGAGAGGSTSPVSSRRSPWLRTSSTRLALLGTESSSITRAGQSTDQDTAPTDIR